jgi:hypothetical protein
MPRTLRPHPPRTAGKEPCRAVKRESGLWTGFGVVSDETKEKKIEGWAYQHVSCLSQIWSVRGACGPIVLVGCSCLDATNSSLSTHIGTRPATARVNKGRICLVGIVKAGSKTR